MDMLAEWAAKKSSHIRDSDVRSVQEMMELEARRERVRQNVALLKKEEEERKLKEGTKLKGVNTGKVGGPDLPSFIRQFPTPQGENAWDVSDGMDEERRTSEEKDAEKVTSAKEFTEPTGSGTSYRPGTWQPPT